MKVQIKAYKEFHGHDGNGYEASIWVDGKRTAIVVEDGWGGGLQFHPLDHDRYEALKAKVESLPPYIWDDKFAELAGEETPMDLELYLGDLIEFAANAKNRKVTTKSPDGTFYTWDGSPYKKANHEKIQAQITKVNDGHIVVNRQPAVATL